MVLDGFGSAAPTVGPDYGWVIIASAVITLQATMVTMAVAKTRYTVFNDEYVKKHLSAESDQLKKEAGFAIEKCVATVFRTRNFAEFRSALTASDCL
jgi:hypothetical protein